MTGAIPLLPLYVFIMWTGATLTVVKKYGGTRNHVLWTAGHQLITIKAWIQQQGSRIESLMKKEVSLLEYLNFLLPDNSSNVSHLSITVKCY